MSSGKSYAVAALFKTPNEIMAAAKAVVKAGYKKFDVHTPYPVHGMDDAMSIPRTKLPFVTLVCGLLGVTIALLFQWWTLSVSYPLDIGGNPDFALPAFMPVSFELTVLLAVLGTIGFMLAVFFGFPANSHPYHDTPYMTQVSCDHFGLAITSCDPLFDEEAVKAFLKGLGACEVMTIDVPAEVGRFKPALTPGFALLLVVLAMGVSVTTDFLLNKAVYLPPFDFMLHQFKLTPQSSHPIFDDGIGMRPPVVGAVARGFMPYPYPNDPEAAGIDLVNPLPRTHEVMARGQVMFNRFCSPCHGYYGKGDGRLHNQFPTPPSLHSEKAQNWPDGRFYHIMTMGQNAMPGYAKQITREDRWAIVHYVRALQRATNAKSTDID